jgi:hypothetical protein
MGKSNKVIPKKKRGRPATGKDPVTALRLSPALTDAIEGWAARQHDEPNRSEAIRRLVELGLTLLWIIGALVFLIWVVLQRP